MDGKCFAILTDRVIRGDEAFDGCGDEGSLAVLNSASLRIAAQTLADATQLHAFISLRQTPDQVRCPQLES